MIVNLFKQRWLVLAGFPVLALLLFAGGFFLRSGLGNASLEQSVHFSDVLVSLKGPDGKVFIIDSGKRRVLAVEDPSGKLAFQINGGERSEGSFYYANDLSVDNEGNLYIHNTVMDENGFYVIREEILQYSPEGHFVDKIYTLRHSEVYNTLVQRSEIKGLRSENGFLYWYEVNPEGVFSFRTLLVDINVNKKRIMDYPNASTYISDIDGKGNQYWVLSTKRGRIVYHTPESSKTIYQATGKGSEARSSIPWRVRINSEKEIYFSDLGDRSVRKIKDGQLEQVLSADLLKRQKKKVDELNVYEFKLLSDGGIISSSGDNIITVNGEGRVVNYFNAATLPEIVRYLVLLTWLMTVLAIILLAYTIYFIYSDVFEKKISIIFKQLLLFVPMFVLAIFWVSNIIISELSKRYEEQMLNSLSLMVQNFPASIDGSKIENIQSHEDFMSEDYSDVRTALHQALNDNRDAWNDSYYFALYRVFDDELYGLMYLNDGITLFHPFDYMSESGSVYHTALEGKIETEIDRDSWGDWIYGTGPIYNNEGDVVAILEVGTDLYALEKINQNISRTLLGVSGIVAIIFIILVCLISYYLLRGIRKLHKGVKELSSGNWDAKINVSRSNDEIGALSAGFLQMAGYIKDYIKHVVSLNNSYYRFVPQQFLSYLEKKSVLDLKLGDQVQRKMTVLFSDIRKFTSISEKMTPKENFNFLNRYLSYMGPHIRENNGFVDKFIGDAIMALFPGTADDGLKAAIAIQLSLVEYNSGNQEQGNDPISIGVGLHTGNLMLGILGEEERIDGTVISDAVNLASRLEGLTKYFGAAIIISDVVLNELKHPELYTKRSLGHFRVVGKEKPIKLYEILEGLVEDKKTQKLECKQRFEEAVELLAKVDVKAAEKAFTALSEQYPEDLAIAYYLQRIERIQLESPKIPFDGTLSMTDK